MTLTVSTDQQLVAATREGDDRAFEELYARYRPRIKAFALRLTHDHHRADDLAQEVFISALRRLRATDRPIDFRPWIYEIARNACIDEYRRNRRMVEVPIDRDEVDGWLRQISAGPSPEVAMESKQQLEDLRGAFRGLSKRHHRIIVARELEGKTYRQIGDELGMSQVVVESTLFRARRRLGEEFEDLSSGRRCEQVLGIIGTASGRRVGLRDRRAVSQHIEHCRPCRREALAAGWGLQRRPALERVAAAIFPVPLLGLLRRAGAAASRGLHRVATSPMSGYGGPAALASGRAVATAATVLAAAVGGGLITQATQAPARGVSSRSVQLIDAGQVGSGSRVTGSLSRGQAIWRRPAYGLAHRNTASARRRVAGGQLSLSGAAAAGVPADSDTDASSGGTGQVPAPALPQPSLPSSGGGSAHGLSLGHAGPGVPSVGTPGSGPAAPKLPTVIQKVAGGTVPSGSPGTVSTVVKRATGVKLPAVP